MSAVATFRRPVCRLPYRAYSVAAKRSFITLPGLEATSLAEKRVLPYDSKSLYALIADVGSYSRFLPYCQSSKVTKWSKEDEQGDKWPAEADLMVGFGGYQETFRSRLFCVPGKTVEALGGEARTTISRRELGLYSDYLDRPATANDIFRSLSTKWTFTPFLYKPPTGQPQTDKATNPPMNQTEVHLSIDFQFSNPIYGALSKAVAPKVAEVMIEAFETRARELFDEGKLR